MSPAEPLAAALQAHEAGRHSDAEALYRQAIETQPTNAVPYNNLGNLLRNQERFDEAIACYDAAIRLAPWVPELHNNLGVALRDTKNAAAAIQSFHAALALRPNYFEALNNLANALKDQGRLEEALVGYRRAAALQPQHTLVLDNLGLACLDFGLYDEAETYFNRSLAIDPSAPHVRWSRSLLMLLRGELPACWHEHEFRWKCPDWRRYCRLYLPKEIPRPDWDGTAIDGKTILLQAEQGLGDTLQFVRYVPIVKQAGGRVILQCQNALLPLLADCGADVLIGEVDAIESVDLRARLLSLPAILHTTLASIPATVPYLSADAALVAHWHQRLHAHCPAEVGGHKVCRVGVNWRGRPGLGVYRARDFPLRTLRVLADLPGVRLISLQRGAGRDDLIGSHRDAWADDPRAPLDLGDDVDAERGAFLDTAAIMRNLDLVITSDTAVAHLAGALGVPVWLALTFAADWRWLLNRSDSPWYPTMRLFRQTKRGDWPPVFQQMATALANR